MQIEVMTGDIVQAQVEALDEQPRLIQQAGGATIG
jgi:hypothetical protein